MKVKKEVIELATKFGEALSKNSQTILTTMSVVSMCAAVGLSVKATKDAMDEVQRESERIGRELSKPEVVAIVWKYYIGTSVAMVVSAVSSIASNEVNLRKNAALAAALETANTIVVSGKDPKPIVEKIIGNVEEEDKKPEREPMPQSQSDETMWFYEPICGRFFKSTINDILWAEKEALSVCDYEMSLANFYEELFDGYDVPEIAENVTWNINDGKPGIGFGGTVMHDGHLAVELTYQNKPTLERETNCWKI